MGATTASAAFHAGSAAVCLGWALLVLLAGRDRRVLPAAAAALAAAAWAAAVALQPAAALEGWAGALEILRNATWFAVLLILAHRIAGLPAAFVVRFAGAGAVAAMLALLTLTPDATGFVALPSLGSPALLARIALALMLVLLAENLARNADETARWSVKLPCLALGGLGVLDVVLYADAALSREFSATLLDARAAVTAAAMPLLVVAAMRMARRDRDPPVSRAVVFHSATLVIAGSFLLGVGVVAEALHRSGADWARAAQASLVAGAVLAVAVMLASSSARSRLRRLVVDHFFAARHDYRREWLRCVATLSDAETDAATRAIRAIADPLDSPAGLLLTREPGVSGLYWAGSWNRPAVVQPVADTMVQDGEIAVFEPAGDALLPPPLAGLGPFWLALPLMHHRDGLVGAVLLAPPRAPLPLDAETRALLLTLGREVALFLAERRASESLATQRRLEEHARRFAFVAHDVKTVSAQLSMLLSNAEAHLQDPDFQRDMLLTVRASAARIDKLIARLAEPDAPAAEAPVAPVALLRALVAARPQHILLQEDGPAGGTVRMQRDRLEAALTHLLNNAVEASTHGEKVRLRVRQDEQRLIIDIADRGPGMTPEFIRDELFRPLATAKPGGSGIGAWQARELLREAGGELTVLSRPGIGTTMRILLPLHAAAAGPRLAGGGTP